MKCEIRNEQSFYKPDRKLIRKLISFLAGKYGRSSSETVSIYFVDNAKIREFNREYLEHDRPTDVMSFTMDDDGMLGDIIVSAEQAALQAGEHGIEHEMMFLLVHGFLHLLGWSDYNKKDKEKMLIEGERALTEFYGIYGNRSVT